MRHIYLATASTFAVLALGSAAAQAETIAGWDFSQYRGAGSMTIDNSTFVNTLSANYSSQDGSFGAGADSATFGTLYMDGTGGSSNISAGFGTGDVQPVAANVTKNLNGPATIPGASSFNTFTVLEVEGQLNKQYTAIGAIGGSPSIVFEADLTPNYPGPGVGGTGWSVSFAGLTREEAGCDDGNPVTVGDCDATVTVEYELDGGGYATVGVVTFTPEEQQFVLPPIFVGAKVAHVRMTLDTTAGRPIVDNVSVEAQYVPEPGFIAQLAAGLVGLVAIARRRA